MSNFFRSRRSKAITERYRDVTELVDIILPKCQDRISVCNYVAYLVQVIHKDIEKMTKQQAQSFEVDAKDVGEAPEPILAPTPYEETMSDIDEDIKLASQLIQSATRPYVRARLTVLKCNKQKHLRQLSLQSQRERQREMKESLQRSANVSTAFSYDTHAFVLSTLKDRAYVCKLITDMESEEVDLEPESHRPGYDISTSEWKDYGSKELWLDVVKIDEVLDLLPEENSKMRPVLEEVKASCRQSAKLMMKHELRRSSGSVRRSSRTWKENRTPPSPQRIRDFDNTTFKIPTRRPKEKRKSSTQKLEISCFNTALTAS